MQTLKPDEHQLVEGFKNGDLSLGQLSEGLQKNHHDTISLLGSLGIAVANYDLAEDLAAVEILLKS